MGEIICNGISGKTASIQNVYKLIRKKLESTNGPSKNLSGTSQKGESEQKHVKQC